MDGVAKSVSTVLNLVQPAACWNWATIKQRRAIRTERNGGCGFFWRRPSTGTVDHRPSIFVVGSSSVDLLVMIRTGRHSNKETTAGRWWPCLRKWWSPHNTTTTTEGKSEQRGERIHIWKSFEIILSKKDGGFWECIHHQHHGQPWFSTVTVLLDIPWGMDRRKDAKGRKVGMRDKVRSLEVIQGKHSFWSRLDKNTHRRQRRRLAFHPFSEKKVCGKFRLSKEGEKSVPIPSLIKINHLRFKQCIRWKCRGLEKSTHTNGRTSVPMRVGKPILAIRLEISVYWKKSQIWQGGTSLTVLKQTSCPHPTPLSFRLRCSEDRQLENSSSCQPRAPFPWRKKSWETFFQ